MFVIRQAKASFAGSTSGVGPAPSPRVRASLLGLALAFVACLLAPAPASALEHPFLEIFGQTAQPSLGNPAGMAVDPATGEVLVIDMEDQTIERYNEDGTPSDFSALGTNVIDGQGSGPPCTPPSVECDGTPQGGILTYFSSTQEVQIAVDNSGGATDGRIYVTSSVNNVIDVFAPSGEHLGQLTESSAGGFFESCGVAVGPDGSVYVAEFGGAVHKFANPPVDGVSTDFPTPFSCQIAAGAGPTGDSIFVNEYEWHVLKLDADTGAVQYTVESMPAGRSLPQAQFAAARSAWSSSSSGG